MLKQNPLQRQPDTVDFASPTQFKFSLLDIPTTIYFVTEVNLPGIAFSGDAIMNSRYKAMPFMGDTLEFSPMELTFLVSEGLSNYIEIHNWMTGIGFPDSTEQFAKAVAEDAGLKPGSNNKSISKNIQSNSAADPSSLTSDATLTILTNKNNPKLNVNFRNCYPTSLSGLTFNSQSSNSEQLTATVTMNYDLYDFKEL
jgi:hypothetical protein